jgi:hypothetical protein
MDSSSHPTTSGSKKSSSSSKSVAKQQLSDISDIVNDDAIPPVKPSSLEESSFDPKIRMEPVISDVVAKKAPSVSILSFCSLIQSKNYDNAMATYQNIVAAMPLVARTEFLNSTKCQNMTALMHVIAQGDSEGADLMHEIMSDAACNLQIIGVFKQLKTNALCLSITVGNQFAFNSLVHCERCDLSVAPDGYGSSVFLLIVKGNVEWMDDYLKQLPKAALANIPNLLSGTQIDSESHTPLELLAIVKDKTKDKVRLSNLKKIESLLKSNSGDEPVTTALMDMMQGSSSESESKKFNGKKRVAIKKEVDSDDEMVYSESDEDKLYVSPKKHYSRIDKGKSKERAEIEITPKDKLVAYFAKENNKGFDNPSLHNRSNGAGKIGKAVATHANKKDLSNKLFGLLAR